MIDLQVDTSGIEELEKDIMAFSPKLDIKKQLLGEIAVDQLSRIKTRTLEGKSFKNTAFAPYSESYKDFRASKGRPTGKVDLFFRGQMFGAMDWERINDGVRLFFNDTTQAAKAHGLHHGYAPHKLPARPFFELSDDDADEIKKQIVEGIEKIRKQFFRD